MPFYFWNSGSIGSADGDLMFGDDDAASTISGEGGDDVILGDVHGFADPDGSNGGIGDSISLDAYIWSLSENPLLADSSIPHTMISNTTDAGEAEYFHIALTAGQTITVDVDFGGDADFIDTVVEIRNSADGILASNDNSLLSDGGYGSFSTADPFLTFTAPSDGTYYISIHPAGAATFSSTDLITINVSAAGHAADVGILFSNDILSGGNGNDQLLGVGGADQLNGDAGNDQLDGGTGNDLLRGGANDDRLLGGAGNDALDGGIGTDILNGGSGVDVAFYGGLEGSVTVNLGVVIAQNTGAGGIDTLIGIENVIGTNLNDTLIGNTGANALNGSGGNDVIYGGSGNDSLLGGEGNDALDGGLGNDALNGGNSVDVASYATATAAVRVNLGVVAAQNTLGAGIDTLTAIENVSGSAYNDILTGNTGANAINGNGGADVIYGGGGNDSLYGGDGNDAIDGGVGNDVINGGNGMDVVSYASATAGVQVNLGIAAGQNTFGSGIDTLIGIENVAGSNLGDTLSGSSAANVINGGGGEDYLYGRAGNDSLTGGAGIDAFMFNTALNALTNVDTITDFVVADDSIDLSREVFTGLGAGDLTAAAFQLGTAANDAADRIIYDSATGRIFYDADGSGAGAQILFARVTAGTALTYLDFIRPTTNGAPFKTDGGPVTVGPHHGLAGLEGGFGAGSAFHHADYMYA